MAAAEALAVAVVGARGLAMGRGKVAAVEAAAEGWEKVKAVAEVAATERVAARVAASAGVGLAGEMVKVARAGAGLVPMVLWVACWGR